MKRITIFAFFLIVIVSIIVIFSYQKFDTSIRMMPQTTVIPTDAINRDESSNYPLTISDTEYAFTLTTAYPQDVLLIPNYEKKQTVNEMIDLYKCSDAINGGFYDTNYSPLGLVISSDPDYSHTTIPNDLFNGFFIISPTDKAKISQSDSGDARIALQSGPILVENHEARILRMRTDEYARRSVIAVTDDDNVLFISIFHEKNESNGPLLAEMPSLVMKIARQMQIPLVSALNLDGGSASTYYSDGIFLTPTTPVGSLFCVSR